MARRGGGRHRKRLHMPKICILNNKKQDVWITTTSPGSHGKDFSVPLAVALRDMLKLVKNNTEAKKVIKHDGVFVDGRRIKDHRFPVGFGDIVSFANIEDKYLVVYNQYGKMIMKKLENKEHETKISKVIKKYSLKKGKFGITLSDGKSLIADNDVKVGQSIKLKLPDNKISSVIKLEAGVPCFIVGGKHSGHYGNLEKIMDNETGEHLVTVKTDKNEELVTIKKYIMAVDKDWLAVITR